MTTQVKNPLVKFFNNHKKKVISLSITLAGVLFSLDEWNTRKDINSEINLISKRVFYNLEENKIDNNKLVENTHNLIVDIEKQVRNYPYIFKLIDYTKMYDYQTCIYMLENIRQEVKLHQGYEINKYINEVKIIAVNLSKISTGEDFLRNGHTDLVKRTKPISYKCEKQNQ